MGGKKYNSFLKVDMQHRETFDLRLGRNVLLTADFSVTVDVAA